MIRPTSSAIGKLCLGTRVSEHKEKEATTPEIEQVLGETSMPSESS
jgi:hypothetical protein